ncbi:MAG: LysM peptidoglycan-binding domain-containing protein [Nitrospirae bacterium]|nr:LysM peptidoglycan-binding domain-containing protein [Nitrospirota bacterium]
MKLKNISFVLVMFSLFLFVTGASAKTVYTVRKGDNLHDIARKHHVSVSDIESVNKVNAKNLKPGTKITIPVDNRHTRTAKKESRKDKTTTAASVKSSSKHAKAETAASTKPLKHEKTERETIQPVKTAADSSKYHVVRKGDTLRSIARKYHVSVSDVKSLNALHSAKLKTGQKLLVALSGPKTYTVRKGDNLWQIAKKFEMDSDDLMEINEMSSPALRVGQRLFLEEKPEVVNVDQKYLVMAKNIEEELKKVPESPEFAEKTSPDKLVTFAKKLLNIPYKFGGNTILGIDCSSYVKKVYGLMGVNLPRTAREQFKEGEEIVKEELSVGDLVFFRTYASFPSHVGIYLGNNLFIHASSRGKKVTIDNLETPYYVKRFIGAKRLISASEEQEKAATEPAS